MERRDGAGAAAAPQNGGVDVVRQQEFDPVEQFRRRGLLFHARNLARFVERAQRGGKQRLLDAGIVRLDDALHRFRVGEGDVVEEAAAQEGVGEFLLVVRGDHHDGAPLGPDRLLRFVDVELHAVELEQQVVRELDIGLVDFVDQQHGRFGAGKGFPQLAARDVVGDVADALIAELAVAQARHGVVFVEPLPRRGGGLDMPAYEGLAEGAGDLLGEHGLPRSGLALDQQRALQRDGGVDRGHQIARRDIGVGAGEFHGGGASAGTGGDGAAIVRSTGRRPRLRGTPPRSSAHCRRLRRRLFSPPMPRP